VAAEEEVQKLVVRLTGEMSSFKAMMTQATALTRGIAKQVGTASDSIKGIAKGLGTFTSTAVGALKSLGLATSLMGSVKAFESYELGAIRMRAAIQAAGADVEPTIARYLKFAEVIDDTTKHTRGQAMALLGQAANMGFVGQAAEEVVKNAMALGAVGRQGEAVDPARMMRAAAAIQTGQGGAVKRLLQLQHAKDATEAMRLANLQLAAGTEILGKQEDQASAHIEKMGKRLGWVGTQIGGVIAQGLKPLLRIMEQTIKVVTQLSDGTKRTIALVVGLYIAFKSVGPALVFLNGLLMVTKIRLALNLILWAGWKALTIAFTAVMWVFNAALAAYNFATSAGAISSAAWSAAAVVAKVAPWLWNAALTATNALLTAGLGILAAFVATVLIVGGAVALAAAGLWGLWKAGSAVVEVLGVLSTSSGPLGAVGDVFREWGGILKDVAAAAQINLPLAFEIAKAGIALAVAQVKQLWPPLWQFIQDGWKIVADTAAATFKLAFLQALANIQGELANLAQSVGIPLGPVAAEIERMNREVATTQRQTIDLAKKQMEAAAARFQKPEDSEEVNAARKRLDGLKQELAAEQEKQAKQEEGPRKYAAAVKGAKDEVKKLEAALYGSGEAQRRMQEYAERQREQVAPGAREALPGLQMAVIKDPGNKFWEKPTEEEKRHTELLRKMEAHMAKLAGRGSLTGGGDDSGEDFEADLEGS